MAEAIYPSNVTNISSMIDYMFISRKAREVLAVSAAKFSAWAGSNQSEILLNGNVTLKADNNTLDFKSVLNRCRPGFQMHSNGMVCVQCQAGFYRNDGKLCQRCPKDSYSSSPGSVECMKCKGGKVTMTNGATSERQCIDDDDDSGAIPLVMISAVTGGGLFILISLIIIGAAWFRCRRKRLDKKNSFLNDQYETANNFSQIQPNHSRKQDHFECEKQDNVYEEYPGSSKPKEQQSSWNYSTTQEYENMPLGDDQGAELLIPQRSEDEENYSVYEKIEKSNDTPVGGITAHDLGFGNNGIRNPRSTSTFVNHAYDEDY